MSRNILKGIPIRFDYYQNCAETWSTIFKEIDFSKIKSVAEICSGWSPKICMALSSTNFSGTFTAIDNSRINLKIFISMANTLNIKFKVKVKNADVINNNIGNYDLVILNHAIEDLVLFYYMKIKKFRLLNPYSDINFLMILWNKIAADYNLIEKPLIDIFTKMFTKAVNIKGFLIISQYPSYQENLYKMDKPYKISLKIICELQNKLKDKTGSVLENEILTRAYKKIENPYFIKENCLIFKKVNL